MIISLQASDEAILKERRYGHVYGEKGTDSVRLLSNADLPGMVDGLGVGMYVSAPRLILMKAF